MNEQATLIDEVWQMTLRCYEADGVKQACLDLQDRHGVGVSALFGLLSLTVLGYRLPEAAALNRVLARAERWQADVIEPLRLARRNTIVDEGVAEEKKAIADWRQRLLRQEIEAEALQQRLLINDFLLDAAATRGAEPSDISVTAAAYMDRLVTDPDVADLAAIETIVAAFADQRS